MYKYKLDELQLRCDIVYDLTPDATREEIYKKCEKSLKDVDFDYMVSIGWRTYWPYAAYKRRIPYVMVDGGIPSKYGKYPTEFIKEVYANCSLFLMTTWFPWKSPKSDIIKRIRVVTQPYSYKRVEEMKKLRKMTKKQARMKLYKKYPILKKYSSAMLVYLNMSDAYVDPFNHHPNNKNGFIDSYGHMMCDYMDFEEIEPCVFYVSNLLAGLETNYPGKALLYLMQDKTKRIFQPIADMCKSVKTFAPKRLDLDDDPLLKKAADVNICRATNCDNQAELSLIGEPCVTSVIPRDYMDEDTAAVQAEKLGICHQIQYDDLEYIKKLREFITNKKRFKKMGKATAKIFEDFWKNYNFWDELFKVIK